MSYLPVYEDPIERIARFGPETLTLLPVSLASDMIGKEVAVDEEAVEDIRQEFLDDDELKAVGSLSEFAQRLVTVNRKPLSLHGREYLKWVYDIMEEYPVGSKDMLVVSGRQIEKSSTIASLVITLCCVNACYSALIVEPRNDQIKVISQQRFDPMAQDSEVLQQGWLSNKNVWQVGSKMFNNGSIANFKSCFYSADSIRGNTAAFLGIDELADILSDNIPVIEECQSHIEPENRFNLYTGTPKTTSNTINMHWNETCQFEWLVRCEACGHYNYLDEKVIGKTCYICTKCGKEIYPTLHGRWVAMKPSLLDKRWGFRITQIMVPFMRHSEILKKMENPNIPRRVFFNEVLGLSYDEGQLLLTEADMLKRCEPRPQDDPAGLVQRFDVFLCAGIDHGTGDFSAMGMDEFASRSKSARRKPSFTAVAFGGFCADDKFRIFRLMRFHGEMANLARQPEYLNEVIREYGAKWIMSDHGFGAHTNARLLSDWGWSRFEAPGAPLLMECEYSGMQKVPIKWHPQAYRYIVNRNFAIEMVVDAIKKARILFFREEEMSEFLSDFTTMYVEYDFRTKHMRYDHVLPDDCFQAVVYCYLAALQRRGQLVATAIPNI